MEGMSQDFLSRWSRRKLEAEHAEPVPAPETAAPPPDPEAIAAEAGEITPEEIAALPPVEELTATSDLVAFLRKGVPVALRNAALRRMWTVDPAIRDFIGEARDYSWDWNTPGGVPVSGPMEPGTDVPAMVRRIFGGEDEAEAPRVVERENVNEVTFQAGTAAYAPATPRAAGGIR